MTSTAAASTRQSSSPPTASYVAATSIARNRFPPPNRLYRMASATRGSTPPSSVAQNSASVSSIIRRSTVRLSSAISATQVVDAKYPVRRFGELLQPRFRLDEECGCRAQLRNALLEQRERGVQLELLLLEAGRDGLETLQARLEAHGSLPDAETA